VDVRRASGEQNFVAAAVLQRRHGVAIGAHDPPSAGVGDPVKLARAWIRIVPKRLGDGFEKFFAKLWIVGTFAGLTTPANELVARIHDRMPAILGPSDYERWLSADSDPHDSLPPFRTT
jgi:hypothetical protein